LFVLLRYSAPAHDYNAYWLVENFDNDLGDGKTGYNHKHVDSPFCIPAKVKRV